MKIETKFNIGDRIEYGARKVGSDGIPISAPQFTVGEINVAVKPLYPGADPTSDIKYAGIDKDGLIHSCYERNARKAPTKAEKLADKLDGLMDSRPFGADKDELVEIIESIYGKED